MSGQSEPPKTSLLASQLIFSVKYENFCFTVKYYHCVNYTAEEQADIDNGENEESVCESIPAQVYTNGRNATYYPGCVGPDESVCMCCAGRSS